jgi:aryl-alcohol dehydrogenase-like predicted oxidoreductase
MISPLESRSLGATDIQVTALGFGCWGLSGDWGKRYSVANACSLLDYAWHAGINLFDTAGV